MMNATKASGESSSASANISLRQWYADMLRIRLVEETMAARYAEQEMRCPVHLSIGQEAAAVGVCAALRRTDKVLSTHRCHAHYLAKGGDLYRMLAEIYGKADGCVGGRGGSMHLCDQDVGMLASIPIVASSIPLAVGSALADKRAGRDTVTVAFFGDASVEEGVFHESANFAQLHKLPVVFVCENNLFSIYTQLDARQPARPIMELASAHAMAKAEGDGNDVVAVEELTQAAVARARSGQGPSFLVLHTYRWREHCGPNYDNDLGYRTPVEFEAWKGKCPVEKTRRELFGAGDLSEADDEGMRQDMQTEIDEAFERARAADLPSSEDARRFVYA
jgi:TPP-dependent pyruvate/acetoin dehydrogenase alpha subunit